MKQWGRVDCFKKIERSNVTSRAKKYYRKVRELGVSIEAAYTELNYFFKTYIPA